MGITTALNLQWVVSRTKSIMNKFLAVACVATVALVKGEADADAFYGPYGYGLGYAAYGAHPYTYGYSGYPYAYAAPTGYAQVSPSASLTTVGLADASIPAVAGGYAGAGRYVANSAGVVHVAKREAEAEADADAFYGAYGYGLPYSTYGAYPYTGYAGYAGYPYTWGAYPYSYAAAPAVTVAAPAVTKVEGPVEGPVEAAPAVATVAAAPAVATADAFYGYGLPYAYGAYPYTGYAGYAGYPYAYGAYGARAYAGYAGYPYAAYAAPVATATAQVSPSSSLATLGLADASIPAIAGGYAGAGRY